ncbi:hypothetical protein COHA_000869 [Chlorella ohadii]|uniref:Cytochrome b5 heme-binding domain-containing protein n=1 Tax=Chlorella ohadii TaxID=2649997 RepID=A0AAD5E007_9CHLO|nr:hypothetical protein COHA_000869 [Chlorella ohadii]
MPSWTPRPPISFNTGLAAQHAEPQEQPAVRLQVVDHPDEQGPALISRGTAEQLGLLGTKVFMELAEGSDCVLTAAVTDDASLVADGQLAATAVHQHNLHLGSGISEEFRVFAPPVGEDTPFELVDVELEVALLSRAEDGEGPVQVDARAVTRELLLRYFGCVLALSEAIVLVVGGRRLLLRVTATNSLDAEAQEERVAYHCFRGLLTHETQIYLHTADQQAADKQQPSTPPAAQGAAAGAAQPTDDASSSSSISSSSSDSGSEPDLPQSLAAVRGSVQLLNAKQRPTSGPSRSCVIVRTLDGEWFPVKRKLLRPCISLTKAVRSEEEGSPEVTVDVDTLTFDRVLIFLEALALGRESPAFGVHLLPQLLAAAQHLGLRDLEEYCQERLGDSTARVRQYRFDEIRQLNAGGGCWLILDGMVLDVTRWLPEHPGGSKIIPRQSLNLDCSRFFELYHASRESFVYLRQFYMGEVAPQDRELVPGPEEPPSAEFLQQLREFTPWRLQVEEEAVATHLGAKRAAAAAH